jgi:hypothetical protein
MLRQFSVVIALLGIVATARAGDTLEVKQYGAEVPLTELVVPESEFGLLRFAVCGGCTIQTARLSGDTTYFVNNDAVTFADFAASVQDVQRAHSIAERSIAGVFFDVGAERVASVAIVTPRQP